MNAGLMHYAQNLQCQPAQFIASFPSSDPGTQTIAATFFSKLPLVTLQATLGLDDSIQAIVNKVKSMPQQNPSMDEQCLNRCGIPIPEYFYGSSGYSDGY